MLLYHGVKDNLSQICVKFLKNTYFIIILAFLFFFFNGRLVQKKEVHLGPLSYYSPIISIIDLWKTSVLSAASLASVPLIEK